MKACLYDLVFMHMSVQLKILEFSSETGKPPLSIFGPSRHHHLGTHILLGGQSPWILVSVKATKQCFVMRLVEPLTGHSKHEQLVRMRKTIHLPKATSGCSRASRPMNFLQRGSW